MKPESLIVRCYAYKSDGLWLAMCVDFTLAVQADSLSQAKTLLNEQIKDYIASALEDPAQAKYLLRRKAPLRLMAHYHWVKLLSRAHLVKDRCYNLFSEVMPMKLATP